MTIARAYIVIAALALFAASPAAAADERPSGLLHQLAHGVKVQVNEVRALGVQGAAWWSFFFVGEFVSKPMAWVLATYTGSEFSQASLIKGAITMQAIGEVLAGMKELLPRSEERSRPALAKLLGIVARGGSLYLSTKHPYLGTSLLVASQFTEPAYRALGRRLAARRLRPREQPSPKNP